MTSAPAQTAKLASTRKRMLETALRFQGYLGLLIVFVIGAIFSPVRDNTNLFLDVTNQMNIVRYVATTGIIAIGMTLVILIGEIDLAVGSVLAFVVRAHDEIMERSDERQHRVAGAALRRDVE